MLDEQIKLHSTGRQEEIRVHIFKTKGSTSIIPKTDMFEAQHYIFRRYGLYSQIIINGPFIEKNHI